MEIRIWRVCYASLSSNWNRTIKHFPTREEAICYQRDKLLKQIPKGYTYIVKPEDVKIN